MPRHKTIQSTMRICWQLSASLIIKKVSKFVSSLSGLKYYWLKARFSERIFLKIFNAPHISIFLYDETNQTVTNDVRNDEQGQYQCYGNFSWFGHYQKLSMTKEIFLRHLSNDLTRNFHVPFEIFVPIINLVYNL